MGLPFCIDAPFVGSFVSGEEESLVPCLWNVAYLETQIDHAAEKFFDRERRLGHVLV